MNAITDRVRLHNGVEIPLLGLGVFRLPDEAEGRMALESALETGYRLFDTASVYGNEAMVGRVLSESGIPREELFITTKAWNDELGQAETREAVHRSLERLKTDYIDLYLIHWPLFPQSAGAWKAMQVLNQEGTIRAIGVSNFSIPHLQKLEPSAASGQLPVLNQVEFHPRLVQTELLQWCRDRGIQLQAWSPFMRGGVFSEPILQEIARSHEKSIGQVVLRWILQKGIITIPKSVSPERIRENAGVFDFSLNDSEMGQIDGLHRGEHLGPTPDNFQEYFRRIGR